MLNLFYLEIFLLVLLNSFVTSQSKNQTTVESSSLPSSNKTNTPNPMTTTTLSAPISSSSAAASTLNGYVNGKFYCDGKVLEKDQIVKRPNKQKCGGIWYIYSIYCYYNIKPSL